MSDSPITAATLAAQQIVVRALADLLARDLPPATWTITAYNSGEAQMVGQLDWRPPLANRRAALACWAEVLGIAPELRRYRAPEPEQAGAWHLQTEYLGAQVDVWVSLTEADLAELDAEQAPAVKA